MNQSEETNENLYDLSLTGAGISVSKKVPQAIAYRVIAVLMGGMSTSAPAPHAGLAATVPSTTAAGPPTSIGQSLREYMDSVKAKRNPEKILAITKYLIENAGQNVKRDEVKAEFKTAAEPVPANYNRDFMWAVQVAWLAEDRQNRGHYYVTSAGDEALRQNFADEIRKKTKQGMGGRRRRRKRATVSSATNEDTEE